MPPTDDVAAGRAGKATSHKPAMNGTGTSDEPIVPMKWSNKAARSAAVEIAEGRGEAKATRQSETRTGRRAGAVARPMISTACVEEVRRQGPRSEPRAVILLAGICAGGGSRGPSLRDPCVFWPAAHRFVCAKVSLARRKR